MCGICGFTGQRKDQSIYSMTQAIFHRGPDEDGFYSDEQVSLGMRRLSIIDLLSGKQPVHNEDNSIWLVFNGEIYNFEPLRKLLLDKGHRFYTHHSDTETIVHLYEEYGLEFVHKLNGMFAIALWDKKNEQLVLIRDRMGVKPLFYSEINSNLVFASEIKSILCYPGYHREMNKQAIYHYFSFKNIPAPFTAFKGIHSLLPGELLVWKNGQIRKEKYWQIAYPEDKQIDETETRDTILSLLEDAVRIRMISDVPFGAYLSGGVDSSAVVALMNKYLNNPVKTFSLGYEDEMENKAADLYFARSVSKKFNTDHYEYIMSYREVPEEIDKVIKSFDQPFSGTISTYFLSKLISRHVKVALSGDGADELFGSYLAHRLAQPMYHFSALYPKYKDGRLTGQDMELLQPFNNDLAYLERLYLASGGDDIRWRCQLLTFSDKAKENLLSPDFIGQDFDSSSEDNMAKYFKQLNTSDPLNRILGVDWNSLLPDQVLAFVDFLSMAHSVEVRSPFLDYRLVEFVGTIPGRLKIKDGNVKDILKKTVEPILPEGITRRPKEGFVLPVFDWLNGPLRGYSQHVLSEKRMNAHGIWNQSTVLDLLSRFLAGDKTLVAQIWNLMMFQLWWEQFFK